MNVVQDKPTERSKSEEVTPKLVEWLTEYNIVGENTETVCNLIKERNDFGIRKYGTPLKSFNGRDCELDAQQELADCLQYFYQLRLEGNKMLSSMTIALVESVVALTLEMNKDSNSYQIES